MTYKTLLIIVFTHILINSYSQNPEALEKEYIDKNKQYIISKNGKKGLQDINGKEILPVVYRDIKLMDTIFTLQNNCNWVLEENKKTYKPLNVSNSPIVYKKENNKYYPKRDIDYVIRERLFNYYESIFIKKENSNNNREKQESGGRVAIMGMGSPSTEKDFDKINRDEFINKMVNLSALEFSQDYLISKSGIPAIKQHFDNLSEYYDGNNYIYFLRYHSNDTYAYGIFNNELKKVTPKYYFAKQEVNKQLIEVFRKVLARKSDLHIFNFDFNENIDSSGVINNKGIWIFKPTVGNKYFVHTDNLVSITSKVDYKEVNALYCVKGESITLVHPNCILKFPYLEVITSDSNKETWTIDNFGRRLN